MKNYTHEINDFETPIPENIWNQEHSDRKIKYRNIFVRRAIKKMERI
jgi:hypothetical protein